MKKILSAFALVSMITFSSASYAGQKSCTKTSETREFYFRALYTNFMIARDKCGTVNEYTQFMKGYKDDILSNVSVLKKYYKSKYGKSWKRHMDAFMTKVANDISVGTNGDEYYRFCYHSWKMLHMMNNIPSGQDVDTYVHKYAKQYSKHLPKQCPDQLAFWENNPEEESKE